MARLRYDGPGGRLVAFDKVLLAGEVGEFTEQEAAQLFAQPHIHVTALPDVDVAPTRRGRKPQIPAPSEPTVVEPVPAEELAQPEAREGEGQPPDQEEEE